MKGILLVNKKKGMTSHDVVDFLRKKLKMKRIGHTGTLDPMATGVLPICIGNSTRLAEYIVDQGKSYIAELEFGKSTNTYDKEGQIDQVSDKVDFDKETVEKALDSFHGIIEQIPPKYSAVRIKGKRLYDYARKNIDVDVPSRKVEIKDIGLLELDGKRAKIYIKCSKGTYIRSLIHDLGLSLGTYAHMTSLIRNEVGNFDIDQSLSLDQIQEMDIEDIKKALIASEDAIKNLDAIYLKEDRRFELCNGQKVNLTDVDYSYEDVNSKFDDIRVFSDNRFLGIGLIDDGQLKMRKNLFYRG